MSAAAAADDACRTVQGAPLKYNLAGYIHVEARRFPIITFQPAGNDHSVVAEPSGHLRGSSAGLRIAADDDVINLPKNGISLLRCFFYLPCHAQLKPLIHGKRDLLRNLEPPENLEAVAKSSRVRSRRAGGNRGQSVSRHVRERDLSSQ